MGGSYMGGSYRPTCGHHECTEPADFRIGPIPGHPRETYRCRAGLIASFRAEHWNDPRIGGPESLTVRSLHTGR